MNEKLERDIERLLRKNYKGWAEGDEDPIKKETVHRAVEYLPVAIKKLKDETGVDVGEPCWFGPVPDGTVDIEWRRDHSVLVNIPPEPYFPTYAAKINKQHVLGYLLKDDLEKKVQELIEWEHPDDGAKVSMETVKKALRYWPDIKEKIKELWDLDLEIKLGPGPHASIDLYWKNEGEYTILFNVPAEDETPNYSGQVNGKRHRGEISLSE